MPTYESFFIVLFLGIYKTITSFIMNWLFKFKRLPPSGQSQFVRAINSPNSVRAALISTTATISRVIGIIFLIILGFKSVWWYPFVLWLYSSVFALIFSLVLGFFHIPFPNMHFYFVHFGAYINTFLIISLLIIYFNGLYIFTII